MEWLHDGLQNRIDQFESDTVLHKTKRKYMGLLDIFGGGPEGIIEDVLEEITDLDL